MKNFKWDADPVTGQQPVRSVSTFVYDSMGTLTKAINTIGEGQSVTSIVEYEGPKGYERISKMIRYKSVSATSADYNALTAARRIIISEWS